MTQKEQNYQAWMGLGGSSSISPSPLTLWPTVSDAAQKNYSCEHLQKSFFALGEMHGSSISIKFTFSPLQSMRSSLADYFTERGRTGSLVLVKGRPTPCWWRQDMTRSDKRAADGNLAADGPLARQGTRHHSLHTSEHNKTLQPAVPFRQYTSKYLYLSGEKERRRKEKRGQRVREKTWSCEIWC